MHRVHIIVVIDNIHKGDDANAIGIGEKTLALFNEKLDFTATLDISEYEDIANNIKRLQLNIIVAAGEHNLPAISPFKQDRIHLAWSGHQVPATIWDYAPKLDFISIPTHTKEADKVALRKIHNASIIETVGVAHNTKHENLITEYQKWQPQIISGERYYLAVLGGDAPDENGQMNYYTAEEAYDLGKYIALQALANNATVLSTNGPRTGKHDPITEEALLTHRELHPITKEPLDYRLDAVSAAFISGLIYEGLTNNKNFQFFDFRFGKNGVVSAYKALLGAVLEVGGHAYIPGESTSMVSEACSLLPPQSVTVFNNSAMNETHKRHVKSTYKNIYANLLLDNMEFTPIIPQAASELHENLSATETIAKAIVDDFDLSLTKKSNSAEFFKAHDRTAQEATGSSAMIASTKHRL